MTRIRSPSVALNVGPGTRLFTFQVLKVTALLSWTTEVLASRRNSRTVRPLPGAPVCPQCWPRHASVHVPGVEGDGAVKLDGRSISFQAKFAYRAPVFARHRAVIKIPRNLHWVDIADGDCICGHWRYSRHSRSFLGQILQCDRAARYPSTSYS